MFYEILLRRRQKVCLDRKPGPPNQEQVSRLATMMKNIETLGYTFSRELFEMLCGLETEELNCFYWKLIACLKQYTGADKTYRPMYPNFPEEVMNLKETELYLNAIVHYWSYGALYPSIRKKNRLPLFDETEVTVLKPGNREDLMEIFTNLAGADSSLSEQDLKDIRWYFTNMPDFPAYLPPEIPIKENAAFIGKCLLKCSPLVSSEMLLRFFQTATDVLRLAAALSDGDISLKKKVRFCSFTRKERRILMDLLAEASGLEEAMHRRPEVFKRLGERLHPGEYRAERYQRVVLAFEKIRNGEPVKNFAGSVEAALLDQDVHRALELLKSRPGELARRLDVLLRRGKVSEEVLETFAAVADQAATPLLLQVRSHFQYRNHQAFRYYFPKGKLASARMFHNAPESVEEAVCTQVVSICEEVLTRRFAELAPMGKVYLSEALKDYIVPFNQRSASKAARTLVRGSRLPICPKAKVVRGFIWWTNLGYKPMKRVDLDLSAVLFDKNWNYMEHISYTNLRSARYRACHSGDIVDGGPPYGKGVCEFLDVDLDSVVKYKGRYVVYQVYSYTRQSFAALPNASFGYMERQDVGSGEIFEPRTVRHCMDLVSDTIVVIPMILDCVERKMIWCDAALNPGSCCTHIGGNNLESNLSGVALACYTMVNMHRTNLYDLLKLHIDGRGELCKIKEDADIIFDVKDGITPFDTDIILAEYMK